MCYKNLKATDLINCAIESHACMCFLGSIYAKCVWGRGYALAAKLVWDRIHPYIYPACLLLSIRYSPIPDNDVYDRLSQQQLVFLQHLIGLRTSECVRHRTGKTIFQSWFGFPFGMMNDHNSLLKFKSFYFWHFSDLLGPKICDVWHLLSKISWQPWQQVGHVRKHSLSNGGRRRGLFVQFLGLWLCYLSAVLWKRIDTRY